MKKYIYIFCFGFLSIQSCSNRDGEIIEMIKAMQTQNEELKVQINTLQNSANAAMTALNKISLTQSVTDKKVDALQTDLKSVLAQLSGISTQILAANANTAEIKVKLDALQSKCADLVNQINSLNAILDPNYNSIQLSNLISGMLVYLNFDGNVLDNSGNGLNGELYNATYTSNRLNESNKALNFSTSTAKFGQRNQEVFIPYSSKFNSESLSVSIWVNPNSYGWSGDQSTFSTIANRFQYGYSNPNGQAWHLVNTSSGLQAILYQASTTNTQSASVITSRTPLTLGIWTHIVMTFDGTIHKLYINGTLAESKLAGIKLNTSGNSGISIGESNQANGYWFPFNGKLDDFGLWNRALTDQEVNYLYTNNFKL